MCVCVCVCVLVHACSLFLCLRVGLATVIEGGLTGTEIPCMRESEVLFFSIYIYCVWMNFYPTQHSS